jgi:hypothetical protein
MLLCVPSTRFLRSSWRVGLISSAVAPTYLAPLGHNFSYGESLCMGLILCFFKAPSPPA